MYVLAAIVTLVGGACVAPEGAAGLLGEAPPTGSVSWLSTGDSYASGEGIAGTGVGADVCAQSPDAFGPLAARLLREQRQWLVGPEVFSACTGAKLVDFDQPMQTIGQSLWAWTAALGAPPDGRFDVVTLSIGGNDIDFSTVLKDCIGIPPQRWSDALEPVGIGRRCDVSEADLISRVDGLEGDLVSFFRSVVNDHLTPRGKLVIAGYPQIFAPVGAWSAWRGNRCALVHKDDAAMLNRVASRLDERTREAVQQAGGSERIVYVPRLPLFNRGDGHTLCARGAEWLNGITVGFLDGSFRPSHSFHPNELGHAATAEQVAADLDHALRSPDPVPIVPVTEAPPEATRPPITTGRTYEIGDRFEAECVVAWPTAPVRYRDHVEMRTSCAGIPSQFLFVDIAYGDPNLPVTPSRSSMRVRGRIVDIGRSEFGFTTLIVVANDIQLR